MRKLLLVLTVLGAVFAFGGAAQAASGPPGWQPCTATPWTPTYNDGGSLQWAANGTSYCNGSSDVDITACMFIGDNPNVEFCKKQIFYGHLGLQNEVFYIPNVTGCFASGFHWVGTRLYTRSRGHQTGTVTYTWSSTVRSPDGSGSYGQCRV